MSYFTSKYLLAAKAIAAKDWSHPAVLRAARHLGHDGLHFSEIGAALWPEVTAEVARRRLAKFNIPYGTRLKRARLGQETSIPYPDIDFRSYRPRGVAK